MIVDVVILAAGAGRRLSSAIPKPLLPMAGNPLIAYVLSVARKLSPRRVIVVCPPAPAFAEAVRRHDADIIRVVQATADGTADALRCALPHLSAKNNVLVLCADTPLLSVATLRKLVRQSSNALVLLTFIADNPTGYGRIVRDNKAVTRIVEERDADAGERKICEVYSGTMAAPATLFSNLLDKIGNRNAADEHYITDIAALTAKQGIAVNAVLCRQDECAGVNTAADLEYLTRLWRARCARDLLNRGVRLADASRIDVRGQVRSGKDVEIDVNVILEGEVHLADGCQIGAHCIINNCRIGAGTVIAPFSHLENAVIGARCRIGPYARLRPGSVLADEVHIGNFVEVKNSRLKKKVKAGHLSYLGDSTIGEGSNIGAGVITCNYDGENKHRSTIGDDVFIGSDSQLVAPVKIGRGAYIAAGTTVTQSVAPGTLAISRSPQQNRKRNK